ncbi:exocyst complex subunit Exo7 [Schizosaccharomyces pombe]|uniref:Exocyst complex component exo70 n=1 Tax=Schizosaccharomyces pombe (strain 972 / ATCC 24843) TaxID=284812 RepID=EXO70_SCHPO|nr:putative exocyst complex subunit Exo70 [Schizosaccharomyces pombe]Q10339.1 RecName: Full=Exocyst complex component exo70 [Schizosaccharomyces pombe 972h-]CAB53736.2 exocyst complex subunit Exo70 (predicted) [Schizosaccharomyces pombe]|eukprot:NP_595170.2 putative exocyst complex subunit Exo70 [Schizosaccharomyces pombe]
MSGGIFDDNKAGFETFQKNLNSVAKNVSDASNILLSMDKRLSGLEASAGILRDDVTNYNRVSSNIYDTLKEMESLQVIHSHLPVLQKGLQECQNLNKSVSQNLKSVMDILKSLAEDYTSLEGSPLQFASKSQQKVEMMLSEGCQILGALCYNILETYAASSLNKASTLLDLSIPWSFPNESLQQFIGLIQQFDADVLFPVSCSSDISNIYIKIKGECVVKLLHAVSMRTDEIKLNEGSVNFVTGKEDVSINLVALSRLLPAVASELLLLFDQVTAKALYPKIVKPAINTVTNATRQLEGVYEKRGAAENFVLLSLIDCIVVTRQNMNNLMPFEDASFLGFVNGVGREMEKILISSISRLYNGTCHNNKTVPLTTDRVSEMTHGIMSFLNELAEHENASYLLESIGNWGWRHEINADLSPARSVQDITRNYVMDCMDSYLTSVQTAAQAVDTIGWKMGVMLLNISVYFEAKCLESKIASFLQDVDLEKLGDRSQKYSTMYMEVWRQCSQNMLDSTYTKSQNKSTMSAKEREITKEKFRNFNEQVTSVVQVHRESVRFETGVATFLLQEVKKTVLPLYQRFYDKYINSDFTKNKDKYIKFTKADLDSFITSAFAPSL